MHYREVPARLAIHRDGAAVLLKVCRETLDIQLMRN